MPVETFGTAIAHSRASAAMKDQEGLKESAENTLAEWSRGSETKHTPRQRWQSIASRAVSVQVSDGPASIGVNGHSR